MLPKITFKASPLTLVGRQVNTGAAAPDFRVTGKDLKEAGLSDFKGKIKLISSFPSIDTPVCDAQVKEFNKKAASLSSDIAVIAISKDLPFALSRFCSLNEIKNEVVFSDYKYSSFGINYGLLIKELNLLARSVLIIDKNDRLRYFKVVPELTQSVDYQEALGNLEAVLKSPALAVKEETAGRCLPCEGVVSPLPKAEIEKSFSELSDWEMIEGQKIVKTFKFKDFREAKYFLDLVSMIAEEQGHHPALTLTYNKLKITLTTHAAGGLTKNDFILAGIIDTLNA